MPGGRRSLQLFAGGRGACQIDPERAATIDLRLHADGAGHRLGEPAREGEAEAGALDAGHIRTEALERLEQQRELLGRNPRAGVGDGDAKAAA